jgi:hypothetical protein
VYPDKQGEPLIVCRSLLRGNQWGLGSAAETPLPDLPHSGLQGRGMHSPQRSAVTPANRITSPMVVIARASPPR